MGYKRGLGKLGGGGKKWICLGIGIGDREEAIG